MKINYKDIHVYTRRTQIRKKLILNWSTFQSLCQFHQTVFSHKWAQSTKMIDPLTSHQYSESDESFQDNMTLKLKTEHKNAINYMPKKLKSYVTIVSTNTWPIYITIDHCYVIFVPTNRMLKKDHMSLF